MNSKLFFSLGFTFASLALFANPLLANPLDSNSQPEVAQASSQASDQASNNEDWSGFPEIKDGFMQGCVGADSLAAEQATTKQSYCQCAFESYSGRFSPQEFLQINTLVSRIGEDGPLMVNLMMSPELNGCSEKTGYQF
jgi:hypothetical protein